MPESPEPRRLTPPGSAPEAVAEEVPSEDQPSQAQLGETNESEVGASPVWDAGPVHHASPVPFAPSARTSSTLPRFLMIALGLAGTALAVTLLRDFSSNLAPVFLALNLMIAVYPLQRWLVRHRVPRGLAAVAAGLLVIGILFAFLVGLVWSVAAMVTELPHYSSELSTMYQDLIALLERFGFDQSTLVNALKGISPQSLLPLAGSLLSNVRGVLAVVLVVLTTVIFLAMDSIGLPERLVVVAQTHSRFALAIESFVLGVRRYWIVTTVFGLVVAVLDWLLLVALEVPLAGVWAIFSFLTNYVPNIGFVVGLIPPALLAYIDQGWGAALVVIGAYCVLNFVVQSIIQPKFAGEAVGITPTMSFLSLLIWTWVLGPLGALLALPMTLLVKALVVDVDPGSRWVNALISSRPLDGLGAQGEGGRRGPAADQLRP